MNRIAIINTVSNGSTGKIANAMNRFFTNQGYYSVLCYGYGDKPEFGNSYKINTTLEHYIHALKARIFGTEGQNSTYATKRLVSYLEQDEINVVYAISLHGYYLNRKVLFDYLIKKNMKVIYLMIDENAYVGKCGYANDCKNYLNGCGHCPNLGEYPKSLFFDKTANIFKEKQNAYDEMKNIVFVGPKFVVEKASMSPLLKDKRTFVLDEAIDVELFKPYNASDLRKALGIAEDKTIILCVAPFSYERKGVKYYIQLAKRFINEKKYVFVHVGFNGDKSICPPNYIPIDFVKDQYLLAQYYSMADLFVFPSLLDTMPNACLESLACGTPILCFNISGMPYIANDDVGTFVEPRNVDELERVILNTSKKSHKIISTCREYALKRYDNRNYNRVLLKLMKEGE